MPLFNFEKEPVESISTRCKNLRKATGFRQGDITDRKHISNIETAKYKGGDNFISISTLESYVDLFEKTMEEIIFENEVELEELLRDFFSNLFRLVGVRNLDKDMEPRIFHN